MAGSKLCPTCKVAIGELHKKSCDISRCKAHGLQLILCAMPGGCAPTKFIGDFNGTQEAIDRGWYVYLERGQGWIRCDKDHPDAWEDLNRVMEELTWNPATEMYE